MLSKEQLVETAWRALLRASVKIPEDIKNAFKSCVEKEENESAKIHLMKFLENIEVAVKRNVPVCPDTGWPMFFVKLGDQVNIEGGYSTLKQVFKETVEKATKMGMLRVTMVDPLTRKASLTNVGSYVPEVEYKPVSTDYVEITAVTKGGGAELFILEPFRILLLADGIVGIKKFIIDAIVSGATAGKTCPPNVVGIGIGGTNDLCMKLAKQAAALRPVGDRHPEPRIAKLEEEILNAINSLNIGPMGCGGIFAAFDVHIEYAHTHTVGNAVAVNTQCALCRRGTVRVYDTGIVEDREFPQWFER